MRYSNPTMMKDPGTPILPNANAGGVAPTTAAMGAAAATTKKTICATPTELVASFWPVADGLSMVDMLVPLVLSSLFSEYMGCGSRNKPLQSMP